MFIGASTASLYPKNTEDALLSLAKQGITDAEIFINCNTELENPLRGELTRIIRDYSMNILAVHPLTVLDSFFLFSNYDRRLEQYMEIHKRYFDCMNEWGAKIFIFHGLKNESPKSDEFYFERFFKFSALAKRFDITVAQENIAYCKSGNFDFLKKMKSELDGNAAFTLDLKQAVRSGFSPFEFLRALGKNIVHIHASDNGKNGDCLPIGKGEFDFYSFFNCLKNMDYNRGIMLELYRDSFNEETELFESVKKLKGFIKS